MTFLLDVNVLIALTDVWHLAHCAATEWFEREGRFDWATCPITQNGLVRIVGGYGYPNGAASPGQLVAVLETFAKHPGHHFWPDDISLRDGRWIDVDAILTSGQVTDTYLLALAVSKNGKLATLDKRLTSRAVRNGAAGLFVIPQSEDSAQTA